MSENSIDEEKIKKHFTEIETNYMKNYQESSLFCLSLGLNPNETLFALMNCNASSIIGFLLAANYTKNEVDDFFELFKENFMRIKAEHEQ
jgi:hypothetical protein